MKLIHLLDNLAGSSLSWKMYGMTNRQVKGVYCDSRLVKKAGLFVAIKGLHVDAHSFIDQVLDKGVSVVVGERTPTKKWLQKVTYIRVNNSRLALGLIASWWFGNPSKKVRVIGVTGTDGKTTTCNFIYSILTASGQKTGLVTSINAKIGAKSFDTGFHVTNPDQIQLQRYLYLMARAKCKFAVLEVTSHGLDQERVAGIKFHLGLVTNITHEHLDYHKTYAKYLAAKARLLQLADIVVLNKDDKAYTRLKNWVQQDYVTFSLSNNFLTREAKAHLSRFFPGSYNMSNALGAAVVCRELGLSNQQITAGLLSITKVFGRAEKVHNTRGINLLIDFAHTPNALKNVLLMIRKQTKGRLICVFGCASERDNSKRPIMGYIASKYADVAIFTAEDPRNESVEKIMQEMALGALEDSTIVKIADRGRAIWYAINKVAQRGDTVVLCGKGHERSMAIGGIEYPWSDHKALEYALVNKALKITK